MLVEHSFVTTLDESSAMERAALYFQAVGLRHAEANPKRKPRKNGVYKGVPAELVPRNVQVNFDRGRINTAIAMEPKRKPRPAHSDLLMALASGLELSMSNTEQEAQATHEWKAVLERERTRVRRSRIIGTIAIILACGAMAGLAALAAS